MEKERKEKRTERQRKVPAVFEKMARLTNRAKICWADWMARKTSKMSRKSLYAALVVFVSIGTIYNSLVLSGFWKTGTLRQGSIAVPKDISLKKQRDGAWTFKQGLKDINSWRSYGDSLRDTKEGRAFLDSVAKNRPELLDSMRNAEAIIKKF